MKTKHKGSQCCGKCYDLLKNGESVVRKINPITPDTLFHSLCASTELQNTQLEIYFDKGETKEIQIQKTA